MSYDSFPPRLSRSYLIGGYLSRADVGVEITFIEQKIRGKNNYTQTSKRTSAL